MICLKLDKVPLENIRGGFERLPGLHVSGVIRDLDNKLKMSPYSGKEPIFNLDNAAHVGFLWEDMLSRVWVDSLGMRPLEIEVDGIIGSPDGIKQDEDWGLIVEEYKCTWLSSSKEPTDVWRYVRQSQAYCYMVGTQYCLFHVLYLNGDYKFSSSEDDIPCYNRFMVCYEEEELVRNWRMLVTHAQTMQSC